MELRRDELTLLAAALAGFVIVVDLLWNTFLGSTGTLVYGVIDLPAHFATCVIALLAVSAVAERHLTRPFVVAALVASVAIDIDHVPGYLGSQVLTAGMPRPGTHSALVILTLLALAGASRRLRSQQICLGLAFGVLTHLLRDLATGPGVPLLWPFSVSTALMPYVVYAGLLVVAAGIAVMAPRRSARRRRVRAGLDARPLPTAYPPNGS